MTRSSGVLGQPCLFISVHPRHPCSRNTCSRSPCSRTSCPRNPCGCNLVRARQAIAVRHVGAHISMWDFFRWFKQELAIARVASNLVDDVRRCPWWLRSCKCEWQRWPGLERSFSLVSPQSGPRRRVLMFHDLLNYANCYPLESVYQALRMAMKRMSHHVVEFLAQSSCALL